MSRRSLSFGFAMLACTALASAANTCSAHAQSWPSKTVKIVVPFTPGGGADVIGRLLAGKLQEQLKVPVIVENRGGVGGVLGSDYVAKQPADGYTILYNTNGQAISAATFKKLPFDPFNDFIPVTQMFASNLLLVGAKGLAAKNFSELVALAKSKPGKLNYGSSGVGNPLHLTMELLKLQTGMDIQMVPFRSDADILNALHTGAIDVAIVPLVTGKGHVQAGEVVGLGLTAARRAPDFDIPTIAEQGLAGFDAGGWQGLFVAAKTPDAIVARLHLEATKAFESPEMQARVRGFGLINAFTTPGQFAAFYKEEVENFKRIVRDARIPLQE